MEGCIPDLLGRRQGEQVEQVDDHRDLHCSAYQMKGAPIGVAVKSSGRDEPSLSLGCNHREGTRCAM